jgi:tetratricopeptide (TPR) repeat protein
MNQYGKNIMSLEFLNIDYFKAENFSGRLLFTFTEFSNRTLDGFGFGGKFAIENGFDLIAVKSSLDDWYQSITLETFYIIEKFLVDLPNHHNFRATYGSSMGGYAAFLFARTIKDNVAFALSPQFDIARAYDTRWDSSVRQIGPISTLTSESVYRNCQYIVAYDPMDADKIHFDKYVDAIYPNLIWEIKVPYAGHPVGGFLNHANIMKEITLAALNGNKIPVFQNKLRTKRQNYPDYYFNLSRVLLKRRKLKWAHAMILKAIELNPLNSEFRIVAAQIVEETGDLVGAILHAAAAVALAPRHPNMVAALSRFLQKKGFYKQALHHLDIASVLAPDVFSNQRAALEIEMSSGTTKNAVL